MNEINALERYKARGRMTMILINGFSDFYLLVIRHKLQIDG